MAFPTGWGYYASLTISSAITASLENNVPFVISRASFASNVNCDQIFDPSDGTAAQADGGDIRCAMNADGSGQIPIAVVAFAHDSSSGAQDADVKIVVQLPNLYSAMNTVLYFFWVGNSSGSQTQPAVTNTYGRNSVWLGLNGGAFDAGAVYELQSDATDYSGKNSSGTVHGATLQSGGGYLFNGSSDYIDLGTAFPRANDLTIIVDMTTGSSVTANQYVFNHYATTTGGRHWAQTIGTDLVTAGQNGIFGNSTGSAFGYAAEAGTLATATRYEMGITKSGTSAAIYRAGSALTPTTTGTLSSTLSSTAGAAALGRGAFGSNYFGGYIWSARYYQGAVSANWMAVENTNRSNPATDVTPGDPTPITGGNLSVNPAGLGGLAGAGGLAGVGGGLVAAPEMRLAA